MCSKTEGPRRGDVVCPRRPEATPGQQFCLHTSSSRAAAALSDSNGTQSITSLRRALGGSTRAGTTRSSAPSTDGFAASLKRHFWEDKSLPHKVPTGSSYSKLAPPRTVECLLRAAKHASSHLNVPDASHIVVPNPSLSVCAALKTAYPALISFPCVAASFFGKFENRSQSTIASTLQAAGWAGSFDVVWLDYCGTFSSKAGRRRQADLRQLFRFGLLASEPRSRGGVAAWCCDLL